MGLVLKMHNHTFSLAQVQIPGCGDFLQGSDVSGTTARVTGQKGDW